MLPSQNEKGTKTTLATGEACFDSCVMFVRAETQKRSLAYLLQGIYHLIPSGLHPIYHTVHWDAGYSRKAPAAPLLRLFNVYYRLPQVHYELLGFLVASVDSFSTWLWVWTSALKAHSCPPEEGGEQTRWGPLFNLDEVCGRLHQ